MKNTFETILKNRFNFLIKEFQFRLQSLDKIDGGFYACFINKYCGVCIRYEFREAYLFITLHKLIDGKPANNSRPISQDTPINAIALDDILFVKNPLAIVKPAYAYGADSEYYDKKSGLDLYVTRFADNLRDYAADVLNGNFDIFSTVSPIIKKRSENEHTTR